MTQTSKITMRGALEPVEVIGSFKDVREAINMAAANGMSLFSLTRADNDKEIAFNMGELSYIEEAEEYLG